MSHFGQFLLQMILAVVWAGFLVVTVHANEWSLSNIILIALAGNIGIRMLIIRQVTGS